MPIHFFWSCRRGWSFVGPCELMLQCAIYSKQNTDAKYLRDCLQFARSVWNTNREWSVCVVLVVWLVCVLVHVYLVLAGVWYLEGLCASTASLAYPGRHSCTVCVLLSICSWVSDKHKNKRTRPVQHSFVLDFLPKVIGSKTSLKKWSSW